MTVLFVGTEAGEFGGDARQSTGTNARDANYTAEEVELLSGNGRAGKKTWPAEAEIWFHCRAWFCNGFTNNSSADGHWVDFFNQSGNGVAVRMDVINGTFRIESNNQDSTTFTIAEEQVATIDIHIVVGTTNIDIEVFVDGGSLATLSVGKGGVTGISGFMLQTIDLSFSATEPSYFSEILVQTTDTRGRRVAALKPDSAGGNSDFTGDFNDVLTANDGNVIAGDTDGDITTFGLGAYSGDSTPAGVEAVVVKTLARKGETGPQNAKAALRIGSTNYEGAQFSPDGNDHYEEWTTNPDTTSAWAVADLASLEAGIKAET